MKYLSEPAPRWLGLVAYIATALLWYYAVVMVLDSYKTACQLDRHASPGEMTIWSLLVWIAPVLVARSSVVIWINIGFGFVVLIAAILFAIASHNPPECTTMAARGIDSSGWFEFETTDDLSTFICYAVTFVDLLRWALSKAKSA